MNKFLKSFVIFSILTLLNNSCNVSNDVVQNTRISKRKYTKGLNIQKRNNHIFPELNFKEYNRNNNLGLKKNNPNKSDKSFIKSFIFFKIVVLFRAKILGRKKIKISSIVLMIFINKLLSFIWKKLEFTPPEFKKIKNSDNLFSIILY